MTKQQFIAEAKARGKSKEDTLRKYQELEAAGKFDAEPIGTQQESAPAQAPIPQEKSLLRKGEEFLFPTASQMKPGIASNIAAAGDVLGYIPRIQNVGSSAIGAVMDVPGKILSKVTGKDLNTNFSAGRSGALEATRKILPKNLLGQNIQAGLEAGTDLGTYVGTPLLSKAKTGIEALNATRKAGEIAVKEANKTQGSIVNIVENTLVGWGNTGQVKEFKDALKFVRNPEQLKSVLKTMEESGNEGLSSLANDLKNKISSAENELSNKFHGEVMGALGKDAEPQNVQHWEGLGAIAKAKGSYQGADLGEAIKKTANDWYLHDKESGIVQEALDKMPEFDLSQTINVAKSEINKIPDVGVGHDARIALDKLAGQLENIKSGGKLADEGGKSITLNDYAKKVKIKDSTGREYGIAGRGKVGMNETQFAEKFAADYPGLARSWDIVDDQGLLTNTNNLIEKLAKNPNVKLVDASDQMSAMAKQFTPNQTVKAADFKKMREMIDGVVKWDAPEKKVIDNALIKIRGSMKAELINKATETGNKAYAPAMKKWADDIDMVAQLKDKIGSNPQSFINNITEKNKTESLKLLAALDDLAGTNFVDEAEKMLKTGFKDKMVEGAMGEKGILAPEKFTSAWGKMDSRIKGAMFNQKEASAIDKSINDFNNGVSPFSGHFVSKDEKTIRKKLENIMSQNNIEELKELKVLDGVFGLSGEKSFTNQAINYYKGKLLGISDGRLSTSPMSYTGRSLAGQNAGKIAGGFVGGLLGHLLGLPMGIGETGMSMVGLKAGSYLQSPAGINSVMKIMESPLSKKLGRLVNPIKGSNKTAIKTIAYPTLKPSEGNK